MYADSSHANARYCYSGGYRYFSPVENSTGCIRLNKMQKKQNRMWQLKEIPRSRTRNSVCCIHIIPSGFPRSVNKYRKDFCQPVALAAQLFNSYTIDIASSAKSSKNLGNFLKNNLFLNLHILTITYFNPCIPHELQQ